MASTSRETVDYCTYVLHHENLRDELTHQEMREEVQKHVAHHSSHGEAQQDPLEPAAGLGCAVRDEGQDQRWDGTDEPSGNSRIAPCVLHVFNVRDKTQ